MKKNHEAVGRAASVSAERMAERVQADRRPLHTRVYERVLELIEQGVWGPGDKLPPEVELARELGVSRSTLREALWALERGGHIVRQHGAGTFVAPVVRIRARLPAVISLNALARDQNLSVELLEQELAELVMAVGEDDPLELEPGEAVVEVRRVKTVNGRRAAYYVDRVPTRIVTRAELETGLETSVIDFLCERLGCEGYRAIDALSPERADEVTAAKLAVSPGALLMTIEETVLDPDARVVAWSRARHVAELFEFQVERAL